MTGLTKISRRSFIVMPICLAACKNGASILEFAGKTMGTVYNLVAVDSSKSVNKNDLQHAVELALAEVNTQMSNWDASSEISRFNASASTDAISVSPALGKVMSAAEMVHEASAGRFDTTMGPLIELWGFGANGARSVTPSDAQIAAAQDASGHANRLRMNGMGLQKSRPNTQVYLAAIGKGYGADRVGETLKSYGIKDFMIEIGGDLYASGRNPDGLPWQIGIETPEVSDRGLMRVVGISNLGMASSGDYRNYFEQDGQRYSHVIDPTTGRPITHHTASATVLAEDAMLADAWATAMLTLGREKGLEIAESQDIAVMFIDRDTSTSDLRFKTSASTKFNQLTA